MTSGACTAGRRCRTRTARLGERGSVSESGENTADAAAADDGHADRDGSGDGGEDEDDESDDDGDPERRDCTEYRENVESYGKFEPWDCVMLNGTGRSEDYRKVRYMHNSPVNHTATQRPICGVISVKS